VLTNPIDASLSGVLMTTLGEMVLGGDEGRG
jgi:hypothetical protein